MLCFFSSRRRHTRCGRDWSSDVCSSDLGPGLERGDESLLSELLGETDVAHHPRETGDDLRGLDPPDRVDRAMGGGSRHYRFAALLSSSSRSFCSRAPSLGGRFSAGKSESSCTWRISIVSFSEAGQ